MNSDLLKQSMVALPVDQGGKADLSAAVVEVLASTDFPLLPVDRQIAWILHCFQTAVRYGLSELEIIRSFVHYHSVRLYKDPSLTLSQACILTESIHGLNWADAQSLFDMRGYDRRGVQPFRNFVRMFSTSFHSTRPDIKPTKPLRIAYLCHYAHTNRGNALGPMIRSIVINHFLYGRAWVSCYCVQWCDQSFTDTFKVRDIHHRVIPQELKFDRLDELFGILKEDKVDVVISDVASPIASWLFINRVAPLQMYLDPGYPHWNMPELDWVLLPGKNWEKGFELPGNRWSTIRVTLPEASIGLSSFDAGPVRNIRGPVRFGAFTRLIKFTEVWLSAAEEILTRLPEATLLIVGPGNAELVQRLVDHPGCRGRVNLINEMVELRAYRDCIDIFLDTFPFIGGLVCREMMGYGIPIVSLLSGEWDEFLRESRDSTILAKSIDEFINLSVRLAMDAAFYGEASANSMALSKKQNDPSEMVRDIENSIGQAIAYHWPDSSWTW